jgi:replicative DNA helicase
MSRQFTERQLLGSMLLGGGGVPAAVKAGVRSCHYTEIRHSVLHDAMVDACIDTRGRLDALALSLFLTKSGKLEAVGGNEYLIEILETVPTAERLEKFAADVIRRSDEC